MKKRIIAGGIAAVILTIGASAFAHPPGSGKGYQGMDPQARVAKLTKKLDLYPDQVPQVEAIFAESRAQIQAIRETNTLAERDQARAEMQVVREETHERLSTVLTAEQMEKLDSMKKRHRGHKGKHHRGKDTGEIRAVQPIMPPEDAE